MKQRTRRLGIRLTEEEYSRVAALAANYKSASALMRAALSQFSDRQARKRFELMDRLYTVYKKHDAEMSWSSSNLNQVVRRIHEMANAGLIAEAMVSEILLPAVKDLRKCLLGVKQSLRETVNRATMI